MEENGANINTNQNGTENTSEEQGGNTFTQEQVNAMISKRLKQEREKFSDYESLKEKAGKYDAQEEANKTELQKATEKAAGLQAQLDALKAESQVREIREEVATATGVPASLLHGSTKEDCEAEAKALLEFAGKDSYPEVKDGGSPRNTSAKKEARDMFAEWANKVMR